ncbi:hypothetical protein [Paenibacillus sp. FSL R5-0519]|uniref:hypothetical protein n=1 Tax=Paenibacillus sp. FSL R5-0519 TaxID=2921648 RepID=UPI0030D7DDE4
MEVTAKRLYGGNMTIAATNVYTVPSGTITFVKAITICNTAASAGTVTLYFGEVPLIYEHVIKGKDTLTIPFFDQIMMSGEKINIRGSAANITLYISGKEVT